MLTTATGVLAAVRSAPAGLEVLALLGAAVPVIYGVSWILASAGRRTPVSLVLTGREHASRGRGMATSRGREERQAG